MPAAATDKFKKLSKRWVGQIGAGGVSDGVTGTIPLSSVTNLPTDTAVVAVIDRVDANGTATSNLEETVIGIVSGSNLTNCVRGAEGSAQAHNAGAVVEILVTAKGWNDLVDGLLVNHTQLGFHGTLCDVNGATWIHQEALASAVNYLDVANSLTGSEVSASAAGTDSNIDLGLYGKGTGKLHLGAKYSSLTADTVSASAVTSNMASGNIHTITLSHTATTTISLSNVSVGQVFILRLLQDSTGTNLVTWFTTIKWAGGTAPTLTTTASKADVFGFLCTSSGNYDGFVVGQNL